MIPPKQIKIMFTGIVILVMLFSLVYYKSFNEFFFQNNSPIKININRKNNILWLSNDLEKITQLNKGTFLLKNSDIIHSNEYINNNFKYNGFVFKPNRNVKNMQIGLRNEDSDQMSHYFDIKENKIINIVELDSENKHSKQNINFCGVTPIKKCLEKNNTYQYNDRDFLGITISGDRIVYFIANQDNGIQGTIIHKSINLPILPLQATIINNQNDNLIDESYWINNIFMGEQNKWSVNVIDLSESDKEKLPPKESLSNEEDDENTDEIEKDFSLDNVKPWDKKIYIIEQMYDKENNIIELNCITNMKKDNMKYLRDIFINIIFKIDNKERILSIPYKDYKILNDNKNLNLSFKLDLEKYNKYLINIKNFNVNIELVRSNSIQMKNIISNIVNL